MLILKGDKEEEYQFTISLSGFFKINGTENITDKDVEDLINKNSVVILMPYLRSEVTILTAQPETESVILPIFNINKMLDNKDDLEE